MKRLFLICILFILAAPAQAQEAIEFTAEVDRTAVSTDERVTLTLTVSGNYQQLSQPQLPLLSGFNIVSSSQADHFSMINGVVSRQKVFSYQLQPTVPGAFSIDPVAIQVDGAIYQTEPITIQVGQGAAPTLRAEPQDEAQPPVAATPGQASAPNELSGQDVYIEADVDNPTPFVGQQIVYRFYFYQAVNLSGQPQLDWPTFSGFWSQDLAPNNVYEQVVANRRYRVTEVRRALFATAAGQMHIEPSTLIIPGGFFSRDTNLSTNAVVVDVKPLPGGAPEGFAGAVGQFEISAWVEPTETRANEPLTLFVRVSGAGNLHALPDPTEGAEGNLPDWRVYEAQISTNVSQQGDVLRGDRLFERLLVPKTAGELHIPPFSLVYFDPQAGAYRQAQTEPLTVQVAPGESLFSSPLPSGNDKQDLSLLAGDIRHIKAAPPSLAAQRTPPLEQPLYWLGWLLPLLAVMGIWAWERRRQRLGNDVAYARAQRARRAARKQLAQARKQAQEDEGAAHAAVARALGDYVGDKFNLPSAGLTRDAIRQALAEREVPGALVQRSLACLDWADAGRFSPIAAGRDVGELVSEAENVVAELEQVIGK
jgi:hypothetical protein